MSDTKTWRVAELLGDGISAELSASVHSLADAMPFTVEFEPVDLSLANRSRGGSEVYDHCEQRMRALGTAIKYPTITEHESPNKVLRDRCRFAVIHRPVMTIPGIENHFTETLDIDVIRVATGGTYEDQGRRIGPDTAVSLRVIERQPSLHAARYAFKIAMLRGSGVVSTSKYTIQRAADGLFEEAVESVSHDYPGIAYRRELFDALLAGLILHPDRYGVIVCPNEYGDFLSDMACGLIGSIGLGDSSNFAFDPQGLVTVAMFDPAGGTAPDIAGQGVCNPAAALLAFGSMVRHLGDPATGRAIRTAVRDTIAAGRKTRDIGGDLGTADFTAAVIETFSAASPSTP